MPGWRGDTLGSLQVVLKKLEGRIKVIDKQIKYAEGIYTKPRLRNLVFILRK